LLLASLTASSALAAGCGGGPGESTPTIPRADAARLISLARSVARDAPLDACAAGREAAALGTRARALVAAGRVPAPLEAQLLVGVAAVAAGVPACTPAPAAVALQSGNGKGHGKGKGHDHGHGRGHGHGHGRGHGGDEGD